MTTLNNTYSVGLPWTMDQTVVQASTCTTHCSQVTSIHAVGRIRTRNPSKQTVLKSPNLNLGASRTPCDHVTLFGSAECSSLYRALGSATKGFGTWGTWQSTSLFEREDLHFKCPLTLRNDVICANSHICTKIPTGSNI
jgi:hypothetical protein